MYKKLTLARKFLHYYFTAANGRGHGIHSPFIYRFVRDVLNDKKQYEAYASIEKIRTQLLKDDTVIMVEDMGAGSAVSRSKQRKINEIARAALKPPKYAQLLYRMAKFYRPQHVLELGTSLGITASYFAAAVSKLTTIEGAPAIAEKARENFEKLGLQNIQLITGDFDEVLQPALEKLPVVDLAFIDGNHRKAPTLRYFEQILARSNPQTIFIFDDIHWSEEMEAAWDVIKKHPAVTCTVDLFFIGLVFLRDEFKTPQHFTIRF
jgi:predicted O-methyltransferase YrrM